MGVGMLLYLVKHSRPDNSNSVRELPKVADGATEGHFKALLRTNKYVLGTEHHGLLLQPQLKNYGFFWKEFQIVSTLDTHGYVLYFCGALIAWKSKAGKSVTLSSTEAEYHATSELANEVICC
jgi:hypothetical protein